MDSFVTANEDLSASGANIFPKKRKVRFPYLFKNSTGIY